MLLAGLVISRWRFTQFGGIAEDDVACVDAEDPFVPYLAANLPCEAAS